jgi:hypothetical protein
MAAACALISVALVTALSLWWPLLPVYKVEPCGAFQSPTASSTCSAVITLLTGKFSLRIDRRRGGTDHDDLGAHKHAIQSSSTIASYSGLLASNETT